MANGASDLESIVEATHRRELFAVGAVQQAVRQKAGKPEAHGTFSVKLHFRAGRLEQVTVEDSTTYK